VVSSGVANLAGSAHSQILDYFTEVLKSYGVCVHVHVHLYVFVWFKYVQP
jgi:hypothetical protein